MNQFTKAHKAKTGMSAYLTKDHLIADLRNENDNLHALVQRLQAALQRIVDEADSDDGLTAWDGGDIAREALKSR